MFFDKNKQKKYGLKNKDKFVVKTECQGYLGWAEKILGQIEDFCTSK